MPSKIEQVAVLLAGLDKYELECVPDLVRKEIEVRPTTGCKLLDMPVEIRDMIYHSVALSTLRKHGHYRDRTDHRGILGANKQLHIEFTKMCYSEQTIAIQLVSAEFDVEGHVTNMSWTPFRNTQFKKLLFSSSGHSHIDQWRNHIDAELETKIDIEDDAREILAGDGSIDNTYVHGICEIVGKDWGRSEHRFSMFWISQQAVEAEGLKDEVPNFNDFAKLPLPMVTS